MNFNYTRSALLFLALAMARPAAADILFFDLNVSDHEVDAARKAAEARHEKLLVFPDMPKSVHDRFTAINLEMIPLEKRQETLTAEYNQETESPQRQRKLMDEYNKISEKMDPLKKEQHQLALKYPFSWNSVNRAVAEIQSKKGSVSTIIVSGHSNGLTIWGADTLGQEVVHPTDLSKLSGKFPAAMRNLHSLLLWGCYAGTLGSAKTWKSELPQLKLTAGFFDSGPSGLSAASANLLGDFLRKDEQIMRKEQMKELNAMFRDLSGVTLTNAAMLVNGCYFNVKEGAIRADDPKAKKCPDLTDRYLISLYTEYMNYFSAGDEHFANPPPDPHHSAVRDFYSFVQKYSNCPNFQDLPPRERILSLIFFESVKRNFAEYYKKEIQDYNDTIQRVFHGKGNDALIPDLSSPKTTRTMVIHARAAYENAVTSISNNLGELTKPQYRDSKSTKEQIQTDEEALETLQKLGSPLTNILSNLYCVPMTWITTPPTAGIKPDAPTCQ